MQLGSISGQSRVIDALRRSINTNRVAHAYLFEGISGCGRRSTAIALIQAVFCKQPVDGDACGKCISCIKVEAGNHPDIQFLSPLPDKRDITIEQVRELQQVLSLRPYEAKRKACLIEPAERMNEKSANALLKTLEEPPGDALIILLTTQGDLLLSTIRSRCQHLLFSPLDETTITKLLEKGGLSASEAAFLAPLAEGSLDTASMLDSEGSESRRIEIVEMLASADTGQISTIFDTGELLSVNRDENVSLFTVIVSLLRDMVIIRTTGNRSSIANRIVQDRLTSEAARFSASGIMEALELTLEVRKTIIGNANAKLSMEHFLLAYCRLRA